MTELNESIRWLEREVLSLNYGIIALSIIVHAGKVKRLEKTITQKEQIEEEKK